ncbi:MAG: bifunctional D-glycero-beta-D-manno-heptose-7-phosphate kinase/D-glycero-beta-D-manno-heptose 1-phosphate adenylyltransferase HldE [Thiohalophilus sp.]|uniref:bifunctional D-glycero-beta-D-manno-heptose-7-phosphate kinase/D-glycero-beta-D-manno-heptose 1-phosphate adenylyltransferase HldE n=1 Tax=Thiohalophilus sp. TaxID=3028392 RepID=UPI00287044C2|nr:bifunctional D-glycero-beta-D-manno-heptose-7-phosphate kinase/D-glycero-beta-D-manno-heptose 1-phosphate adenylyltransferase HldE [Thiohalophilus sp.]MDR9437527.1 bifunctional D-glycero-beta-D-manno-heptose-7-phosphate kinase/D-glycero-beta-D-manno-heptose 1-phosphate adenylyltransferase HldE [Thiohalophilus sp.]
MKLQLPQFEQARVLVIGDLMLDRYWHGDTSRISPEAPVPVVRVGEAEERAGGAGNVALNIAALGAGARVMGLTGDDEACNALDDILTTAGVECRFSKLTGCATVTKLRVLSRHQQLIRLDFEDGFESYQSEDLLRQFEQQLDGIGAVILSDYGKGTLREARAFIQAARNKQIPVLVDPKGSDFERYRGASLITPNLSEFEAVVGRCRNDEEVVTKGMALIEQYDLDALLVTRSERGMTLLRRGQEALHMPTHAREVFDVTGAGDTVISVLGAAIAAGEDLANATAWSNLGAGVVVGKLGTATVNIDELRRAARAQHEIETGVVDEDLLVRLVKDARDHGETVVMTNGCFDILHPGHVLYLQQARKLGDRLVVAVNDDASVRRLKGESRPINTVERRMAVLSALECVDWVVPFTEDTPERLICNVLPDLLVKGGDYKPEEIVGSRCVLDNGGKVEVLEFIEGHSTTDIIKNITDKQKAES